MLIRLVLMCTQCNVIDTLTHCSGYSQLVITHFAPCDKVKRKGKEEGCRKDDVIVTLTVVFVTYFVCDMPDPGKLP